MRTIKFRAWDGKKMLDAVDVSNVGFWNRDAVTLMQFTGLLDKNGKEIYEGDVVRLHPDGCCGQHRDGVGFVEYEAPDFLIIKEHDGRKWVSALRKTDEVIGNIYENPELVKPDA